MTRSLVPEGTERDSPPWVTVTAGVVVPPERPVRRSRVLLQVLIGAVVVIVAVGVVGTLASRNLAEAEAVNDASRTADLLAEAVVQPALLDGATTGQAAAMAKIDAAVRAHVLDDAEIVRVKLWSPDGVIVYSDEARLIGQQFALGEDEREVFTAPQLHAEVSDLDAPENVYERGSGPMLEVYRPVWTPAGNPMLFEIYFRYDDVRDRSTALFRGFGGVLLTSILLLVVLLIPVLWRLLDRLREGQGQRERLLQKALDASEEERRRIAGTLHDGVVQDLVGVSYLLTGAAQRAAATGNEDSAVPEMLEQASGTVRSGIGSLRSLLVDIYPPSLESAGVIAALEDLAGTARSRNLQVDTILENCPGLDVDGERLVYRVARECLLNSVRHSDAGSMRITLRPSGDSVALLEIVDDGKGFDVLATLRHAPTGHFGLAVMADTVASAGAELQFRAAPGAGTAVRLRIPR